MMQCIECNWYSKDKRICVRTNKFQFESMPACNDFKEDNNVDVIYDNKKDIE